MEASSRKARVRWTPRHQMQAEVAAACGASIAEIARLLAVSYNTAYRRIAPGELERQREYHRQYREANPEKARERLRRWRDANRDRDRKNSRNLMRRRRLSFLYREKERLAAQRWRKANPQKARDAVYRYRAANRDSINEARRREWANNMEARGRSTAKARQWYADNKDRSKARHAQWLKENQDRAREYARRRSAIKRSSHRRALVPLNRQRLLQRYALFGNRCAYCGDAGGMTADHVLALTKGGLDEPGNIVPACRTCNSSKNNSPVEEWYRRQPFFSEARWRKIQRHCPGIAQGQLPLSLLPAGGSHDQET